MAAASVLQEAPHSLSGREVDVKRAVPGTNKLFVGGLPQNTTANELRQHFEKFGVVSDAVVMIDPATSRSRGFGFVCFLPGQEGAAAVTSSLQQYDNHRIRGKWIEVKSAAPPHKLAAKNGAASQESGTGSVPSINDYDYEELALAGALPGSGRPAPSPSPSISSGENREPNQRKGDVPALGSPRKVVLGATADLGNPMQAPPPGLSAPMSINDFENSRTEMSSQMPPWYSGQQWPQPFPGFGQLPPFGLGIGQFEDSNAPGLGADCFRNSPYGGQSGSGFSAAESLQRNLETFLRQSMQHKMEWEMNKGVPRDPSVSTTCSASSGAATTPMQI